MTPRLVAKTQRYLGYELSVDLAPCVRACIWRRLGWDGCSALVVGKPPASGLPGRRENVNRPDWHVSRTCAGSADGIREDFLRSENQPGHAIDPYPNPSS